jgi:hypothetical protein
LRKDGVVALTAESKRELEVRRLQRDAETARSRTTAVLQKSEASATWLLLLTELVRDPEASLLVHEGI